MVLSFILTSPLSLVLVWGGRGWMEARLAETGALSQLVSEPGDPVGKPVPGRRKAWEEEAAKEEGGGCSGVKRRVSL